MQSSVHIFLSVLMLCCQCSVAPTLLLIKIRTLIVVDIFSFLLPAVCDFSEDNLLDQVPGVATLDQCRELVLR